MKVKTRDRIIDASLMLFNTVGEPNVTTLLISDELDISPGNLYYHFKSKGDIVSQLFDVYEAEMHDLLVVPEDVDISLEQLGIFLHLIFEVIARYRFLYQDLVNVLSRYDNLQNRFRKILKLKRKAFQTLCQSLSDQQLMHISNTQLDALCEQLALTISYWVSFEMLSHLEDKDRVDLGRGVFQMITLIQPYLVEDAREQAAMMAEEYL
ncbi:MAG: TetR family transcriptional regulator [Alteromonadaceae bacterium]|uniref:TetR/AcrR family transcriptional regulator n=1 Tax=Marinobacter sp. BGYM27 TaxID=2975597 RepID=UPI000C469D7C|nr:TetR/AcrR family transcriptional regulator [Marinobacter sp. BGYM27]MAA63995.1 TetR family transcriptional regulator [Alteromonadaceae bacterium]MBH85769.1 TetR family transcriptional regulator [Alteromonadaceae bacterium]MDG5500331.1 TetR/AcrR family transcriptional regulator [Marinobacter sp. BGYM27]|tara:strand:- start:152 stop:778 length:627 start_codon:yes stop_codon:yes gene_type:complete